MLFSIPIPSHSHSRQLTYESKQFKPDTVKVNTVTVVFGLCIRPTLCDMILHNKLSDMKYVSKK